MKKVMGYEVDGKIYYDKAEAQAAAAESNLASFFDSDDGEVDGGPIAKHILDNLDRFAEIIRPLIRKPRAAKVEAKADEYEAAMGMDAAATVKSKAGVKLGSVAGMGVDAEVKKA